ncbi:MAG: DUF262 domain-containing protein [Ferruginibacter sp.]
MSSNNIQAVNKSLIQVLDKQKYQVDPFQREYKWEKEHIEELLIDLERAFWINYSVEHSLKEASNYNLYYLGPIVLYEKDGAKHIIDGQQRLTSLTLLLIFLNNLQKKVLDKDEWSEFDTLIIYKLLDKKTFNLEIPDRVSVLKKLYEANFEFDEADYINNNSCKNIIERYNDIETLFPPRLANIDVLPLFIYWIQQKLMFTEIKAFDDENAYTIFETMNDRGLQLTPTEMLKSYLLMKTGDVTKIGELDILWKNKMVEFSKYDKLEEDSNFFKAWFRAKYATRQDKEENDFDRIGNRFHYWFKDNDKFLGFKESEDYYYLVKTHFNFFASLYLKLKQYQYAVGNSEHPIRLISFKGISPSLTYSLILSAVTLTDDDTIVEEKIMAISKYVDAFAIYRLFTNESIVQSSINYSFYNQLIDTRNKSVSDIEVYFKAKIKELLVKYRAIDYLPYDKSYSKYILARIYKIFNEETPFEDIYFMRKKDSFSIYQFFKESDIEPITEKIPKGLKDLFIDNLVSFCLIPKSHVANYDKLNLSDRVKLLISNGYLPEMGNSFVSFGPNSVREFFIERNKLLKQNVSKIWNI